MFESKAKLFDSVLANTVQSLTPGIVSQFWIIKNLVFSLIAVLACAESPTVFREYIRENEFLSKTILTCFQGPRWV